jgi:hypothetical protein
VTSQFFYATVNNPFSDLVYIDSLTNTAQALEDISSGDMQGLNPVLMTVTPHLGPVSVGPAVTFDPTSGQDVFTYGVYQIQPSFIGSTYTTDLIYTMPANRGDHFFQDIFPGPFGELLAVVSHGAVGAQQSLVWIDALGRSVIDLISLPDTVSVGGVIKDITWYGGFSHAGQAFVSGQYSDVSTAVAGIFQVDPSGEIVLVDEILNTDPIRFVASDGSTLYASGVAPGDFFGEADVIYQYNGVPLNNPITIADLSSTEPYAGEFDTLSELTPADLPVLFPVEQTGSFSSYGYLASHPDLFAAFGFAAAAAAAHYVLVGRGEGRSVTFDGLAYVASYADLIETIGPNADAGAQHYLSSGKAEGRTISFDPLAYTASHNDLVRAFGDSREQASIHFITSGFSEGRTTTFDGLQYIASYDDLIAAFGANRDAGVLHFLRAGFDESRSRDSFNASQYLANYIDLQSTFGADEAAATVHFIVSGFSEGRTDEPRAATGDFLL